ncbi:MAG: HEAT repeat domain-containing protein [Sedimentisphaerales bacterium]|nr:HEAT repeat domain-containing protein [Sedimentisphaerales bacterium]
MHMAKRLWLLSCLFVLPFSGCSLQEQIEAFRAARTVRLIVEEHGPGDVLDPHLEETVESLLTYAKVTVLGADAETYDATIRIVIQKQALGARYERLGFRYTGARVFGYICFDRRPMAAYLESFKGEEHPPSQLWRDDDRTTYLERHSAPFVEAYRGSDFGAKLARMIGQTYEAEMLVDALKDKNYEVRMVAAMALGDIGGPRVVDPLINALMDCSWQVQRAAAIALGDTGDPRAVDPLINALKGPSEPWYWKVQQAAAMALGDIGDPRAVDPLINALRDRNVRKEAVMALGDIGDPRAVDPLTHAVKDSNPTVGREAKRALAKIKTKRR